MDGYALHSKGEPSSQRREPDRQTRDETEHQTTAVNLLALDVVPTPPESGHGRELDWTARRPELASLDLTMNSTSHLTGSPTLD